MTTTQNPNTRDNVYLANGARRLACSHRDHGICWTPTGAEKKTCGNQVRAQLADNERLSLDSTGAWAMPVANLAKILVALRTAR